MHTFGREEGAVERVQSGGEIELPDTDRDGLRGREALLQTGLTSAAPLANADFRRPNGPPAGIQLQPASSPHNTQTPT